MRNEEGGISRLVINNKEIIIIDYSDSNEDQMIDILTETRKVVREENKPARILAIFNSRSFLTPKVMQVFNSDRLGRSLLERQAAIGVSSIKKWIIDGHNTFHNNTIKVFETKEDALDFLAGD
ncbi:MAG TPA: hypothetical protein DGG95_01925 [Cytophagales bacterium]|jgi:hypothetical protein|nr:hypothetical protein [Cytophagales bacterium]